jgi:hypothetical protein
VQYHTCSSCASVSHWSIKRPFNYKKAQRIKKNNSTVLNEKDLEAVWTGDKIFVQLVTVDS